MRDLIDIYALDVLILLALGWWLVWNLKAPRMRLVEADRSMLHRAVKSLISNPPAPNASSARRVAAIEPNPDLDRNLAEIQARDPRFDRDFFLANMHEICAPVLAAYASGDHAALAPHVSREMLEIFSDRIAARRARGMAVEMRAPGVSTPQILDAGVTAGSAWVAVRCGFREAAPRAEEKSDTQKEIEEAWVFARDVGAPRSTWKLIAIATAADTTTDGA